MVIHSKLYKKYIQKDLTLYPNSGNNHLYQFLFFPSCVSYLGQGCSGVYNYMTSSSLVHKLHVVFHTSLLSPSFGNHSISVQKHLPHSQFCHIGLHPVTIPWCIQPTFFGWVCRLFPIFCYQNNVMENDLVHILFHISGCVLQGNSEKWNFWVKGIMPVVLVQPGPSNKIPQNGWFVSCKHLFLTVLEAGKAKIRQGISLRPLL